MGRTGFRERSLRERLSRVLRTAPISVALGFVLAAVYLFTAFRAGAVWEIAADELLLAGASFGPALAAGEGWRVVSAAFLHGGAAHLLVNLVVLADIAPLVESGSGSAGAAPRLIGRLRRVIGIFIVTAACGFVASAWWSSDSVSIGASGGILGFYGWWLASAWRAAGGGPRLTAGLVPTIGRRRVALAAAYLVAAVLAGFLIPGIDNAAHIGGLLGGAAIGWLPGGRPRVAAVLALGATVFAALAAMPEHWAGDYRAQQRFAAVYSRFVENDRQANAEIQRLLSDLRAGRDAAAVAGEFDRAVTARLRENRVPWDDPSLIGGPPALEEERQRWRRYAELRVVAAESLALAMREPDGAAQAEALERFERAMREARAIADEAERALAKH